MVHAIYVVIQYLCIMFSSAITIGNLYIPNTTTLKNIDGKPAGSYFGNTPPTSSSNGTDAIAEQTADKQDFEFYYGLSPYLHMVFPTTQFVRSIAGHIADFMYGVDVFLNTLYNDLFKLMDIRATFSQGSPFETLLVDGQMLGIVATIIAVIIYFGVMIMAPDGSTLQHFKQLTQNLIVAFAFIGIFPFIANGFVSGISWESNDLLGSDLGDSMDSLTDQLFQQNVISIPYKIQSEGLNPDGSKIQMGSSSSSSSSSSNSSSNSGVFIPVTANGPVHYRQKSYFYMPNKAPSYESQGNSSPVNSSQIGQSTPIPAQELSINLSDMSNKGEQNSWNGLQETSIPSFLREYEHISSVIDPSQAKESNEAANSGQVPQDDKDNSVAAKEETKADKMQGERYAAKYKGHPLKEIEAFGFKHIDPHINDTNKTTQDAEDRNKSNPNFHYAMRSHLSTPNDTITPLKMINNLTIKAHAKTRKKSKKIPSAKATKKQVKKSRKDENKASSESASSNDSGLGIFGYQLDGKDDQASINAIKENWKSKLFGAPLMQYYDEYKINWFNIYTGLIMLFMAFAAFAAKVIGAFFKMVVMYTTTTIFVYKSVSAPKAWKEFLRSFFGIYEMLALDVLTLRLYFESFMYINRFLESTISHMNMPGDDAVVIGLISFCADFYMLTIAIGGVDTIDKLMGPGANTGAHHGWAEVATGLMAMRGATRTAGRLGATGARYGARGARKLGRGAKDLVGHGNGGTGKFGAELGHMKSRGHKFANRHNAYLKNPKYDPRMPTSANNSPYIKNPHYRGKFGSDIPKSMGKHFRDQVSKKPSHFKGHFRHQLDAGLANKRKQAQAKDFDNKKAQAKDNTTTAERKANQSNSALTHERARQAQEHAHHEAEMNPSGSRLQRNHKGQAQTTNKATASGIHKQHIQGKRYPTNPDNSFDKQTALDSASTPQEYQAMKDAYDNDQQNAQDSDDTTSGSEPLDSEDDDTPLDANDEQAQNLPTGTDAEANQLAQDVDNNGGKKKQQIDPNADPTSNVAYYDDNGNLHNGIDSDSDGVTGYNIPGTATTGSAQQARESGTNNPNSVLFVPHHFNSNPPKTSGSNVINGENGNGQVRVHNHVHQHQNNQNVPNTQTSNNSTAVTPQNRTIKRHQTQNIQTSTQQNANNTSGSHVVNPSGGVTTINRDIDQNVNNINHINTSNNQSSPVSSGHHQTITRTTTHTTNHSNPVSTGSNPVSYGENYTPSDSTLEQTFNNSINHINNTTQDAGSNPVYNPDIPYNATNDYSGLNSNTSATDDDGLTAGLFRGLTGGDTHPNKLGNFAKSNNLYTNPNAHNTFVPNSNFDDVLKSAQKATNNNGTGSNPDFTKGLNNK